MTPTNKDLLGLDGVGEDSSPAVLVFVTDTWGYTRGGINVFNTEICSALAEVLPVRSVDVVCVVLSATAADFEDAKARGVRLLVLDPSGASSSLGAYRAHELVAVVQAQTDQQVAWWFGHDIVSGAIVNRAASLASGSRSAVFHHMN